METITKEKETTGALNAFFKSLGERDADGVIAHFSEPTFFYITKSAMLPWTGARLDRAGVKEALDQLSSAHIAGEDKFEMDHVFVDGEEAAVFGTVSRVVAMNGRRFSSPFSMRFTFQGGLITKLLMLEETRKIEDAFIM